MPFIPFKFKKTNAPTRLAEFDTQPSWEVLASKIAELFDIPLKDVGVYYVDKQKDAVTLNNAQDLQWFYNKLDMSSEEIKFVVQDLRTPDAEATLASTWSMDSNLSVLSKSEGEFKLFCCVLGQSSEPFSVKIAGDETVDDLKEAIKKKKEHSLAGIDAVALNLWKLSTPIAASELDAKLGHVRSPEEIAGCIKLAPWVELSEYFSSPPRKHVHVVVQLPPIQSNRQKRKADAAPEPDDFEEAKKARLTALAPSDASKPVYYQHMQENASQRILDDRPSADLEVPPVPLLYSGFGHFVDIYNGRDDVPRLADIDFPALEAAVDTFAETMAGFFGNEDLRRDEGLPLVNAIFSCRKEKAPTFLALRAESFRGYRSDGHNLAAHQSAGTIVEFKDKNTGITSIPEVEAAAYFAQLNIAPNHKSTFFGRWRVPCLALTVVGYQVTFYAIILLGHQYRLVSLTPTLSCLRSASDFIDRKSLYRAFAAASVLDMHIFADVLVAVMNPPAEIPSMCWQLPAVSRLRKCLMPDTMDTDDPERQYLDFQIQDDRERADPSRLLFLASTTNGKEVVIKFTRRYCTDLHALCAKLGCAPQLLAFERLPGGWFGVAMEYVLAAKPLRAIPKDHAKCPLWQKELQKVMVLFHGKNLVHGDLRDTNIIVEDDERVLLVDFDWGGLDGETTYPRWDLHPELTDGRTHNDLKIRKEDDERILAYAFSR